MHALSRRRRIGSALAALLMTTSLVAAAPAPAAAQDGDLESSAGAQAEDPTTFTIAEALEALDDGTYTSVELTEAFLERIDTYEPYYNAFTQMNPDAFAAAAASDVRRATAATPRPLEGVPIVVKDSLDMVGFPTTAAWPVTSPVTGGLSLLPETDAPLTARLKAAGAVILGKTNLPILAGSGSNANNSAYGPTFNALDQGWAPGGSSTGSATAVAGDFAIAGIAEETGGSIQNPASAQSLYAVKPTFGLVPNAGNFPLAGSTRDVLGPLAKSVEDAALMLDVFAGYTPEDPKTEAAIDRLPDGGYTADLSTTALEGERIGLYGPGWRTAGGELSEETQGLYDEAVANLEAQGATVVEDPFAGSGFADLAPGDGGYDARGGEDRTYQTELYLQRLGSTSPVGSVDELKAWAQTNGFGDDRSLERLGGDPTVQPDMSDFYELRDEYLSIFDRVMADNDLDAFVFPQQVEEIGPVYGGGVDASTVSEINISQLPGVVVPDGSYDSGKPFSLIFVGELWSEAKLLSYAYDYADAYPNRVINRDLSTTPGPDDPDAPLAGTVCDRAEAGVSFPDAPGSGHRQFIDCLSGLGVVQGRTDGTFAPRDDVQRAQLASFVARSIELATGETMEDGGAPFPDVGVNSTHGQAIAKLNAAGIVRGYPDGTFSPAGSVSREQTARYVVNAVEYVLGEELPRSNETFPDVEVGSQYASDIDALVSAGIVSGFADGTFGPREPVTRAQMTRFLGNALQTWTEEGVYQPN